MLVARRCVCSLVTATVEFTDGDGVTSRLLDVHRDRTADRTTDVVTTEYAVVVSAGDGQVDVTFHVGFSGTTIECFQRGDTAHIDIRTAFHISFVTAAIELIENQRTDNFASVLSAGVLLFIDVYFSLSGNNTLGVERG